MLVTLGLVCLLLQSAARVGAPWSWAAIGVLISALLIPGGFFLSVLGKDPQRPGRAILLLWVGVGVLTVSLAAVGVSIIVAGASQLG